jgi:hypothetical protein
MPDYELAYVRVFVFAFERSVGDIEPVYAELMAKVVR